MSIEEGTLSQQLVCCLDYPWPFSVLLLGHSGLKITHSLYVLFSSLYGVVCGVGQHFVQCGVLVRDAARLGFQIRTCESALHVVAQNVV